MRHDGAWNGGVEGGDDRIDRRGGRVSTNNGADARAPPCHLTFPPGTSSIGTHPGNSVRFSPDFGRRLTRRKVSAFIDPTTRMLRLPLPPPMPMPLPSVLVAAEGWAKGDDDDDDDALHVHAFVDERPSQYRQHVVVPELSEDGYDAGIATTTTAAIRG